MAKGGWVRCRRGTPCPVCGHNEGCLVAPDATAAVCLRVEQGATRRRDGTVMVAKNGMGWLHRLTPGRGGVAVVAKGTKPPPLPPRLKPAELEVMLKGMRTALSPRRGEAIAKALGVPLPHLLAYGMGWDTATGCYAWPMYTGDGKPCGIRLRATDGTKRCVPGSRNGLFITDDFFTESGGLPPCLDTDPPTGPLLLFLPEGPTDAAACRALGFRAVGRPSNMGGIGEVARLIAGCAAPQDVVVVADKDATKWRKANGVPVEPLWPGWEGALAVCRELVAAPKVGRLRLIYAPCAAKDVRAWLLAGGTATLLAACVTAAPPITGPWLRHKMAAVEALRGKVRGLLAKDPTQALDAVLAAAKAALRGPAG